MSNQLGPIEITCDAPPYPVVQACGRLGFRSPLDVRWSRLSDLLAGGKRGPVGLPLWIWFLSNNQPKDSTCHCGEALPVLERCTFTFVSGKNADYHLGQCRRCRTIFWEEG